MYKIYTTYYTKQSWVTGKNYDEGWFIWLSPEGSINRSDDFMVCHVINDTYNTNGETHGYAWNMIPNRLINGWLRPRGWYKTQEEAMNKAFSFINEELNRLK
jgi:hypothetical protein